MQLMIMNNLDPAVAQFPHELVTYGGNGSVFSNWAQYHLVMRYLSILTDRQTLVLNSGHPQGYELSCLKTSSLFVPISHTLSPLIPPNPSLFLSNVILACIRVLKAPPESSSAMDS